MRRTIFVLFFIILIGALSFQIYLYYRNLGQEKQSKVAVPGMPCRALMTLSTNVECPKGQYCKLQGSGPKATGFCTTFDALPPEENTFCGGIAGVKCPSGYTCKLDGSYPDAGGTCVSSSNQVNLSYTCPKTEWVNCMPILSPEAQKFCTKEYLDWAKNNCSNFHGPTY